MSYQNPTMLGIREVASWQFADLLQSKPAVLAALPSLQRGAVWKPNQIELLWDSVLRGFPIGSLVVCDLLSSQRTHPGVHAREHDKGEPYWKDNLRYTHHLLDGQQRANAIALGFLDPFGADGSRDQDPDALLWLDLAPNPNRFRLDSTRHFLLRVTTTAHPWGFRIGEGKEAGRLEAEELRGAIKAFHHWQDAPKDGRARPVAGCPWDADAPIPLAWLLEALYGLQPSGQSIPRRDLWQDVKDRCDQFIKIRTPPEDIFGDEPRSKHWAIRARDVLEGWLRSDENSNGDSLAQALIRAHQTKIVMLPVPTQALTQAGRNETDDRADHERIANVEHLFQRLNSGGTELRGDDLVYSMIKAYWPGIEKTISAIRTRPPETQVALLGARLALADQKMPAPLTVSRLRSIATVPAEGSGAGVTPHKLERMRNDTTSIRVMFGLDTILDESESRIAQALQTFDAWFVYKPSDNDWGLPPVLRSRMADQAPEVFLFLLHLADQAAGRGFDPSPDVRKQLLGLATALHWFGLKSNLAVQWLWKYAEPMAWLDGSVFERAPVLHELTHLPQRTGGPEQPTVATLLSPADLSAYIDENTIQEATLKDWRWWDSLVANKWPNDPAAALAYWNQHRPFIGKLSSRDYKGPNGLLLMYAQRAQMAHYFTDYDPSRTGYWDAYNVPWDFDHILPQSQFYNRRKNNTLLRVCQEWGNTIGNLHVWPFEENRKRQDRPADQTLPNSRSELGRMFLWDDEQTDDQEKDLRQAFTQQDLENREDMRRFVLAARTRLIRIYSNWFDTLQLEKLIGR